ncbi:FAD binding domain-containing protein [Panaeolus papilionaceus]|nr:FAD binding domain-containing protein [Panaeolus papilionaceus]
MAETNKERISVERNVDVLIIGAGPAGLMACTALAKYGVKVHIIDKRPEKVMVGQAAGIQPRTSEVLQSYGLLDRLITEGNQMHIAAFYGPSPDGRGIQLTERVPAVAPSSARYPFQITIHQGVIEDVFLDSMKSLGIEVERPAMPVSIEVTSDADALKDPNAYAIKTTIEHIDENPHAITERKREVVHSKFVIGADGAHSWVRKHFGIVIEGEQTDYIWGVIDFKAPETDFPDIRNRCNIHSSTGSCMIIPREDDKVRIYMQLDDKSVANSMMTNGRVDKSKIGPHALFEVAKQHLRPYHFETPQEFEWFAIYTIGQGVASKFSIDDRIFIVGDACHTHSPKAGLGMNAGINDSHNLAWKLAQVLKGYVKPTLLQTYDQERRKYAHDLIDFDKRLARAFSERERLQSDSSSNGALRKELQQVFAASNAFMIGVGIQYSESIITETTYQSLASGLQIGQRFPPHIFVRAGDGYPVEIQDLLPSDARFKLVIFAGDTSKGECTQRLAVLSEALKGLLEGLVGEHKIRNFFDTLTISSATTFSSTSNDIPKFLRPHWSKVLIDDLDSQGRQGGGGYKKYGVGSEGTVVIVRPDGYVATLAPLGRPEVLRSYFSKFI